jgi:hypothetical protein
MPAGAPAPCFFSFASPRPAGTPGPTPRLPLLTLTSLFPPLLSSRGYYADVPFVSESVYHQVQFSEYA